MMLAHRKCVSSLCHVSAPRADCKCVYYAGSVAERKALYRDHVETITFNCLVTTYEFVMKDATQLSKARAVLP
jgi:hypothetical protein